MTDQTSDGGNALSRQENAGSVIAPQIVEHDGVLAEIERRGWLSWFTVGRSAVLSVARQARNEAADWQARFADLQLELNRSLNQVNLLLLGREQLVADGVTLRNQIADLQRDMKVTEERLRTTAELEREQLRREAAESIAKQLEAAVARERTAYQAELDVLRKKLETTSEGLRAETERASALQADLAQAHAEAASLRQQMDEATQRLSQFEGEIVTERDAARQAAVETEQTLMALSRRLGRIAVEKSVLERSVSHGRAG